jgi:hypothetical protein
MFSALPVLSLVVFPTVQSALWTPTDQLTWSLNAYGTQDDLSDCQALCIVYTHNTQALCFSFALQVGVETSAGWHWRHNYLCIVPYMTALTKHKDVAQTAPQSDPPLMEYAPLQNGSGKT